MPPTLTKKPALNARALLAGVRSGRRAPTFWSTTQPCEGLKANSPGNVPGEQNLVLSLPKDAYTCEHVCNLRKARLFRCVFRNAQEGA
jgi:hypothetical protein